MGSMFSMPHTMTQLSLRSRTTSSSYSFHPSSRLVDLHLPDHRRVETAPDDLLELGAVVGDAAADPAEREGGSNHDQRQADLVRRSPRPRRSSVPTVHCGARLRSPMASTTLAELVAVLRAVDRLAASADHLDAVLARGCPRPSSAQAQFSAVCPPRVGSRASIGVPLVAARARGSCVTASADDRLEVGPIREGRIGHDRRRVGVDEDDPVALLPEGLARLRSRIVELAALTDDDGTGPDDEYRVNVVSSWHRLRSAEDSPAPRFAQRERTDHQHAHVDA